MGSIHDSPSHVVQAQALDRDESDGLMAVKLRWHVPGPSCLPRDKPRLSVAQRKTHLLHLNAANVLVLEH